MNPTSKAREAYSSWLALPPFVVFLGRRSGDRVSRCWEQVGTGRQLTLVDIGQHTTLGDCDVAQELVQFLIIANSELEVARDDSSLLVVASGITGQFENLGSKVLENGSKVNGST